MMDVCALTSLPADGDEISTLIDQELTFYISKESVSYGSYISVEVGAEESEASHQEHFSFLLCWSCHFLVCA